MDLKALEDFIDKQEVSFICSVDNEGYPNVKAMLKPRIRKGLKEFYFSTNTSSFRVKQYLTNPKASIYFYSKEPNQFIGIMLKGTMEVVFNEEIKKIVWREGDTMYYKEGINDPDYCVLKFTSSSGRYYCNLNSDNFTV